MLSLHVDLHACAIGVLSSVDCDVLPSDPLGNVEQVSPRGRNRAARSIGSDFQLQVPSPQQTSFTVLSQNVYLGHDARKSMSVSACFATRSIWPVFGAVGNFCRSCGFWRGNFANFVERPLKRTRFGPIENTNSATRECAWTKLHNSLCRQCVRSAVLWSRQGSMGA